MRYQFWRYINIEELIGIYKPRLVVELGADKLQSSIQLMALIYKYPDMKVVSVDDHENDIMPIKPIEEINNNWYYVRSVSYLFLDEFPNYPPALRKFLEDREKIDMALVDTDHNFWTKKREIEAMSPHLSENAIVLFHDTHRKFGWNTTISGYADGTPYPRSEIEAIDRPQYAAIDEWTSNGEFKIVRECHEEQGCIAVSRRTPEEMKALCG